MTDALTEPQMSDPTEVPLVEVDVAGPAQSREEKMLESVREDLGVGEFIDPLQALLKAPSGFPEDDYYIKRLNTKFRLRAIDNATYEAIQNQAARDIRDKRTGQIRRDLDAGLLQRLIVLYGCKHPNWNDPQLQTRFQKPLPQHVIHVALLPGEIEGISERVLELSGFGDNLEDAGKD